VRFVILLKVLSLAGALFALGGVVVSGRELLGASPGRGLDAGVDAGVDAGADRDAALKSILYAPASKSFGPMNFGAGPGLGGLGKKGSAGAGDAGVAP
jgi:hypothetical protein